MFGIEGVEIYFPKTYVCQSQYQKYKGVKAGKYTKGLGQLELSFAQPFQDVNSVSLTGTNGVSVVVNNLMNNYNIHPSQVGRLEVGTETLIDRSKSTKTILMTLFKGYHDIEGATSVNACYGATNALLNTLNWISSPFWDGRYGIVVAADLAVYEDGPARCTGGAGAIALLIGPNAKISFAPQRASFMDHVYDFYKPIPSSQYPVVDGKLSIQCYLKATEECYKKLKNKCKDKNVFTEMDYYCFHCPFYKMVQKAFIRLASLEGLNEQDAMKVFMEKVHPTLEIPQRIGNIYTGSLYSGLISLLCSQPNIKDKNVMMFSYGSGLCSTMLTIKIHQNPLNKGQIENIYNRLNLRVKMSPEQYTELMKQRQRGFGKVIGEIKFDEKLLDDNVFYLTQIDTKWRRKYEIKNPTGNLNKKPISSLIRLENLNRHLTDDSCSKFYKLSINERLDFMTNRSENDFDRFTLQSGGLSLEIADTMVENVIGKVSLPLSIIPMFVINKRKFMIPMCIEQPSVVAACSSIGKFLSLYSFHTSSTPSIMIGQVHLPSSEINEIHKIISQKKNIIDDLNEGCESMVKRGGGVTDLRVRELGGIFSKKYVMDIMINVCDAMGANITNMICQRAKDTIAKMGIKTGIAILSNYCLERKALSFFEIPVKEMGWKGVDGAEVAQKILEAYEFARVDKLRATTHNKGIMNGIDAVCVATGQDWRAVESSAHAYASRDGTYKPLTHYQVFQKEGITYFRGNLELPIAVGSIGGAIQKNSLYKSTLSILNNPSAQELAEIMVSVGLAQNFGALRALAIQGIQKGHMLLHAKTTAQKAGVPKHLIQDACKYMALKKKYDVATAKSFIQMLNKSNLCPLI